MRKEVTQAQLKKLSAIIVRLEALQHTFPDPEKRLVNAKSLLITVWNEAQHD